MNHTFVSSAAALLIVSLHRAVCSDAGLPTAAALPEGEAVASGEATAIYLGFGGLNGPGKVVQVDWGCNVVGDIETAGGAKSIVCLKDEVIVSLGQRPTALAIDAKGGTRTFFDSQEFVKGLAPRLSDMAVHPGTADIVCEGSSARRMEANEWNTAIIFLPGADPKMARKIFHNAEATTPPATSPVFPAIRSMAITRDGQLLISAGRFNDSTPGAIYRFPLGPDITFGEPFISGGGQIAADPTSDRWVALMSQSSSVPKIRIFSGEKELKTVSSDMPATTRWGVVAFAPDGRLLYVRDRLNRKPGPKDATEWHVIELYAVDLEIGSFQKSGEYAHESPTDYRYETQLESVAIGKRMNWETAKSAQITRIPPSSMKRENIEVPTEKKPPRASTEPEIAAKSAPSSPALKESTAAAVAARPVAPPTAKPAAAEDGLLGTRRNLLLQAIEKLTNSDCDTVVLLLQLIPRDEILDPLSDPRKDLVRHIKRVTSSEDLASIERAVSERRAKNMVPSNRR